VLHELLTHWSRYEDSIPGNSMRHLTRGSHIHQPGAESRVSASLY
jgi:hypothetical protein